jgi:phosphoglycerate dehydrogenase-like enzyme
MEDPVVVALSENLRGPAADRIAAVSPRVRIVWVTPAGEALDDPADVEVVYRGGGLMPPGVRRLMPRMPRLRWIHAMGAGVDGDLTPDVVQSDVIVTRTRGLHLIPVSEWVMMLVLVASKRFPELVIAQHERRWAKVRVPVSLVGRTIGIVGYGEIGQAIAARARGFGFRLVGTRRRPQPAPELDALYPLDQLDRLLAESDYVVLATPLTPKSRGMFGEPQLRAMRETARLINVGRGEVIQEDALVRALHEGWIAGAALDVFSQEPLPPDNPLWDAPNLIITPHQGGVSHPAFAEETLEQFLDNLGRYLRGEPLRNQVDKQAGY